MQKNSAHSNIYTPLANQIRAAIDANAIFCEGKKLPRGYDAPSDEQALYLLRMSQYLQTHYVSANGACDIAARIAVIAGGKEERAALKQIKQACAVSSYFSGLTLDAFLNPETDRHAWLGEVENPKPLADLFRIQNDLSPENSDRRSTDVDFKARPLSMRGNDDVAQGVRIYKVESSATDEPAPQFAVVRRPLAENENRPKLFYFGGGVKREEESEYIGRMAARLRGVLDKGAIPSDAYDMYHVCYNNRAVPHKIQDIMEFSHAPNAHVSKEAHAFVTQFLRPLYAKGKAGQVTAAYDTAELKARFGLVTLVGYSYGTVFVQEVANAMRDDMQSLGYGEKTIEASLPAIAAFNLASVGKIDPARAGMFTQVHINAAEDTLSATRSNIKTLTAPDRSKTVKEFRVEHGDSLNLLVLQAREVAAQIPVYPPLNAAAASLTRKTIRFKNEDGEHVFSAVPKRVLNNKTYHHINGFLSTTGIRGDGLFTVCATPAADFITKALRAQVQGSIDAAHHAKKPRDTAHILKAVADNALAPDAIRRVNLERAHYTKRMASSGTAQEWSFSAPPGSGGSSRF